MPAVLRYVLTRPSHNNMFLKSLSLIRVLAHAYRHVFLGSGLGGRSELKRQPVYYEGPQLGYFNHIQNHI